MRQKPPTSLGDKLSGHFLIAMPSLQQDFFNKSVTYICEHDDNGSFGIVINQKTNLTLQQLNLQEMPESPLSTLDTPIYLGGPVEVSRGFVLHQTTKPWQSSIAVSETIQLTSSKDILLAIANNKGPKKFHITLGYAGWSAGQLEAEIMNNHWLNCPADESIIFNTPVDQRWQQAAKLIGIDPHLISQQTGHA